MRVLLQRVSEAAVAVHDEIIGDIGHGLLILVCAMPGDDPETAKKMAEKVCKLRLFKDEAGKMNLSLTETGGGLLLVPQFTLAADTRKGRRPGFSTAAPPAEGERLFDYLLESARGRIAQLQCGRFGADMQVSLVNDGPVTFWLET